MSDDDTHQTTGPPTRQAIVYGVCRDCGRANRLLARDTRTCVVEVYDKEAGAYVMRSNPACRGTIDSAMGMG